MNKRGAAKLVIGGVSIGAIILLLFRLWATGLVVDTLEPEFERALDQLDERIVCIPEASSESHEICINNLGQVIANGDLSKAISISTDSGNLCTIKAGGYDYNVICTLNNINKANQIYVEGVGTQRKIIEATQIVSYIGNLQNLKKPIKTGFWIFKKIRYIPL